MMVSFFFTFLAQRIPCKTQHSQKNYSLPPKIVDVEKNSGLEDEFSLQNGSLSKTEASTIFWGPLGDKGNTSRFL